MPPIVFRRRSRLSGLWALLGWSPVGGVSGNRASPLPTAPRLRRDIGLPEIEPAPPIYPQCFRRF
ncbi:hypothetical protein [Roseicyclus persicicus]|uniref:hypothetical protein n=1 Tax=Roseicyclus persicicus TaxID=2650661 RepID=UPI0014469B06|nr:hypothetical protein [Roseibacterium persicicum]